MTNKAVRQQHQPQPRLRWLLIWLGVAACIPLLALLIVRLQTPEIERETYHTLEAVVRVKSQQLENWLEERQGDSKYLMSDHSLINAAHTLQSPASEATNNAARETIQQHLQDAYGYTSLSLYTPQGERIFVQGEKTIPARSNAELSAKAFATGAMQMSAPFLGEEDNLTTIDFYVPLYRVVNGIRQTVALIALHMHMGDRIFPIVMEWPSPSASSEVLLARREGDSLVFISKSRHDPLPALTRSTPFANSQIPAAIALRTGKPGTVRAKDYRDTESLAAYRPVKYTDWIMVAKIDREEALAPLWELVFWISFILLFAFIALSLLLLRVWKTQTRNKELAAENARLELLRESEARYRAITHSAHEAIVTADTAGNIVDWNPAAERMFGYSSRQANGQSLSLIVPPRFREKAMQGFARMMDGDSMRASDIRRELLGLRRDGREILLDCGVSLWNTGSGQFATYTLRDISQQKRDEMARQETLERLQAQQVQMIELLAINKTILQNALVGIVYLRHRRILSCNRRVEEIFGYEPDELLGQTTECLYATQESFIDVGERAYGALAAGAANYSEEVILRRRNGELFWGALNGRAIDPNNPQEGSIWIYADISERRAAEMESQKLRTAVEQAPVSIVITDQHGVIEYVNPTFSRITGYSAQEAIGKNPSILQSGETPAEVYRDMWQQLLAGKPWIGSLRNRRKDGGLIWEDTSISPIINPQGEITHFIAVKEDVTERIRAEKQLSESAEVFRHLFEDANDPLLLIREGRFIDCNTAAVRLLGYHDKMEFLNQRPDELSPPYQPDGRPSAEKARELLGRLIEVGNMRFEWEHLRANGTPIPVEVTLTPITLHGEVLIHTSWRDITERRKIEKQLEFHQTQLESLVEERTAQLSQALTAARIADRTKDEFLANISHELRTPLSAMIGFSNLARPLCSDPRQRDYLDKISNAGQTLSSVINDLLDLSKIAAGHMAMETTTFRLRDLIARSYSVMSWKAEEKRLKLIEWVDDEVPDILVGDTLRLEQIFLNLLSNAIKFTASGHVAMHISVHERHQTHVNLQIEVEDSGIGMNEEQIQQLFKPFSQTDNSISRRFGGTGLGLAICKRLCEMMDGSIDVRSQEGVGTTFRARIWLEQGEEIHLPVEEMQIEQEIGNVRYKDAHVLVVDDQPFNREIVSGLLGAVGIVPSLACDGQEALDLLLTEGPKAFDMLLMDVQMPVMDGISATRALRGNPEFAELPIIAMTAHTMTHEKRKCRDAGMNDHIGKPFDENSFYRTLNKWIPPEKQYRQASAVAKPAAAQTSLPELRGVDLQTGLALLLGDEARYRHWLLSFIDEAPAYLAQARQALGNGQKDAAGIAIHTLKGRAGMLGMKDLHVLAARLETLIDDGAACHEGLRDVEQSVERLCSEISSAFGAPTPTGTAPTEAAHAGHTAPLPDEPMPESIQRLVTLLAAGDGDCDTALGNCLAELQGTAWASRLQLAVPDVRNFQFAAALRRLTPPTEN